MATATETPWAILLCKFNDDNSEPYPRQRYEDLFTRSGVGKANMVDFFSDMSHGKLDLRGSQVFGWYTLNKSRSDYFFVEDGQGKARRDELLEWARQAAADDLAKAGPFFSVVVCMNVPTDLFGGPNGVVCDDGRWPDDAYGAGMSGMSPSLLGQEMGHVYGLEHSMADGSTEEYMDPWDVMSNASYLMGAHPHFDELDVRARPVFRLGPGLNAANMWSRGWLDDSRVWNTTNRNIDTVVALRPLHHRDLSGFLAARVGEYFVEFRVRERWDIGIDKHVVLIHRFRNERSWLMSANNGEQALVTGSVFGQMKLEPSNLSIFNGVTGVEVVEIDQQEQVAKVRLFHRAAFEEPSLVGTLFGGVTQGGNGYILVGPNGIRRIPPHSPLVQILQQVAIYDSSEAILSVHSRAQVRREALSAITSSVDAEMQTLQVHRQPGTLPDVAGCTEVATAAGEY